APARACARAVFSRPGVSAFARRGAGPATLRASPLASVSAGVGDGVVETERSALLVGVVESIRRTGDPQGLDLGVSLRDATGVAGEVSLRSGSTVQVSRFLRAAEVCGDTGEVLEHIGDAGLRRNRDGSGKRLVTHG